MTSFAARRDRLKDTTADRKLDGLVVTELVNVRYLSGFTGSNGVLLLGSGPPILLTDPRYEIQAADQTDCRVRVVRGPLTKAAGSLLRRKRWSRIGFESDRILHATYAALREELPLAAELVPASGLVEQLRLIKSEAEITLIRESMAICSKAFLRTMRRVRPGVREYEVAAELDYQMRKLGAEKPAFDTIVASGPRSALPHASPTLKTLVNNELLLIDMGASHHGYASDMTRMAHLGRPARKAKQLHGAVLEAQLAALDAVRPGLTAGTIDRRARTVLKRHGLDRLFAHSTGHGLGLEIHEPPRIGKGDRTRLEVGMVITVEPGVYVEGFGGVRIEDTIVVTGSGCEILTPAPKELMVI
jgi:Xaa-Pro aminopeptidase